MKNRNLTLDILKISLAFMVVAIHGGFLSKFSQLGDFLTTNGLFRIAVPIFFIINGYYFISVNNIDKLKKWFYRVFLLYLFWMVFYSYEWFDIQPFSLASVIKNIIQFIIGYLHLWYLSGMIGAGILTFIFRNKVKLGLILSVTLFILGVSIQYLGNYHVFSIPILDKLANYAFIHRNFLFIGFPFFYIGFVIRKNGLFAGLSLPILIYASILGGGLLLGESWYNYSNPQNDGGFDNYLSLALICPAIFLLVVNPKLTIESNYSNLTLISTSIYLIHPFWFIVLRKFGVFDNIIVTLLCFTLSLLSSYLLIKLYNMKVRNKKIFKFIL
ncbi:acyltransferase family protein [Photobacterium iliopiscarium]|nr:acyltransferase family protein [Photobacterium iliopiscarium]